ncbi:hypothetical protein NPIL_573971 [Nephila pilipes]|uniref:Uncharacterized protein n=1 Tax=Nephila pilipes TaxID=299642 RepID=A0A8X6TKX4_NEPPI|nr:hypothetical protein NPIL_573971 [Nephila pilipes]
MFIFPFQLFSTGFIHANQTDIRFHSWVQNTPRLRHPCPFVLCGYYKTFEGADPGSFENKNDILTVLNGEQQKHLSNKLLLPAESTWPPPYDYICI